MDRMTKRRNDGPIKPIGGGGGGGRTNDDTHHEKDPKNSSHMKVRDFL
jgi:hypothetical protein